MELTYDEAIESARRRLAANIRRGAPDECWPWTGPLAPHGYGMVGLAAAARAAGLPAVPTAPWVACFLVNGPPGDLHCLHSCGNRACCNPGHLRWGTPAENMQERVVDGRSEFQKLSVEDVREIRSEMEGVPRLQRAERYAALAKQFGVSDSNVRAVVTRKAWAWLDPKGQ